MQLARIGEISIPDHTERITRLTADNEEGVVYSEESSEAENFYLNSNEFEFNPNFLESENVDAADRNETENLNRNIPEAENVDPNMNPPSSRTMTIGIWNDDETKFMLDKFHDYLSNIGPMKKFKNKKVMWEQISTDMIHGFCKIKSATQIENRYKTVVRRKKEAIVNNSKGGRSRKDVPFGPELNKIATIDDSIEPQVIRSTKKVKHFKQSSRINSDSDEASEQSCEVNTPRGSR